MINEDAIYYQLYKGQAKEKCWQHHRIDCPVWFCRMRQGDHDKPIVATKELTK